MRTTLDIDEDVLLAVKERARREHRTAGAVVSDLARQALTRRIAEDSPADVETFHGFVPFPPRGRIVTNEMIDRIRDDESM